jgi:succinyl-diaminopimelate desuccinylase
MDKQKLQELISIESTWDKTENLKVVIDYVETYFSPYPHLFIKRFEKEGKYSIVITTEDTRTPQIFLNGHLDVVEAYHKDMFEMREENGMIYGRGVYDMKGNVLAMMEVMAHFASLDKMPSLGLMITTDEEVRGYYGVKYLLEEEGYSCDLAVIPDGSQNFSIINGEKGLLTLRIVSKGKAGHGSRPWIGENAILRLMNNIQQIQKLFPKIDEYDRIANWQNSLNIGTIRGGDASNQIPEFAECLLDIRTIDNDSQHQIIEQITSLVDSYSHVEIVDQAAPVFIEPDHPFVLQYQKVAEEVLQRSVPISTECGGSDARFFADRDIPVILTNITGGGAHSRDEWANLESFDTLKTIFIEFIDSFKESGMEEL